MPDSCFGSGKGYCRATLYFKEIEEALDKIDVRNW
jgi:hypothetical protein